MWGIGAGCEKNARAFYLKRKCICDKTQVRFTSNARAFDSKRKGVFGEFRKGKYDGLSGLAGIFIKCIYAGCGKIQRLYFSTPVYIESLQNRCQPRQPVKRWPGEGRFFTTVLYLLCEGFGCLGLI